MKPKNVKKRSTKKADDCPGFYHDAYEYIPRIDTKDILLNDKYTHIFTKWWDIDESEK